MEEHTRPEWRQKIMHACLVIGDQMLMASDVPPEQYEAAKGTFVSLHVDDAAEAERVFAAFVEGGEVRMALEETFWAIRFGTPWMINCSRPQ